MRQTERPTPRPTRQRVRSIVPETLEAIAAERVQCAELSLRAFAQRLYDKGIYRAAGHRVAEAGWLSRQLAKAREAGLLQGPEL